MAYIKPPTSPYSSRDEDSNNSDSNSDSNSDQLPDPKASAVHTFSKLEDLYRKASEVDAAVFSEMRSNVLLVSGNHYPNRLSKMWNRQREQGNINEDQRVRLTKNHLGKIVRRFSNSVQNYAPGVSMKAKTDSDLQDQKAAELNQAVWQDAVTRHEIKALRGDLVDDFFTIGETHVYIYWDPNEGFHKGYEGKLGDDGQPAMDEMGQQIPDHSKPQMSGDFVFERIFGFNVKRDPDCEDIKKSDFIIVDKMGNKQKLRKIYKGNEEKIKFIEGGGGKTFRVFNYSEGGFREADDNEVLLRCFYFRPSIIYPKGYYYLTTSAGILDSGELPFGIFPIISECCEREQSSARGRSIIKQFRPCQAEINRSASKMAEHQITLGDDKLITQSGSKLSSGALIPGVRGVSVTGAMPTILPGRSGNQYMDYMVFNIEEIYRLADMDYNEAEKGEQDPYALLYKSASQRKKYSRYTEKIESFLKRFANSFLSLAKHYLPDDMIIEIVGKKEQVNISEFKNTRPLDFQVVIEDSNEDIESKIGRQMIFSQTLQYVGSKLEPDAIGEVLRAMPYLNDDKAMAGLTLNTDISDNIILSLERGDLPEPIEEQNHQYIIKRLTNRIISPDFRFLDQKIKENYVLVREAHREMQAEIQKQLYLEKQGLIPMTGALIKADIYVSDPLKPSRTTRATIPYDALNWLVQKLQQQGVTMAAEASMSQEDQLAINRSAQSGQQPQDPQDPQQPQQQDPQLNLLPGGM